MIQEVVHCPNLKPAYFRDARNVILKALSLGALHGYGVGQRIAQISGDALKIAEGSLNNQRAKFYKLTRAGRKQLIIERAELGAARGRNDQGAARGLKEDSDYVLDQSHYKGSCVPGGVATRE